MYFIPSDKQYVLLSEVLNKRSYSHKMFPSLHTEQTTLSMPTEISTLISDLIILSYMNFCLSLYLHYVAPWKKDHIPLSLCLNFQTQRKKNSIFMKYRNKWLKTRIIWIQRSIFLLYHYKNRLCLLNIYLMPKILLSNLYFILLLQFLIRKALY